jgi:hypothetical protein
MRRRGRSRGPMELRREEEAELTEDDADALVAWSAGEQ